MSGAPFGALVAFALAVAGTITAVTTSVITAASGADFGPWASGGAGAVAVGALAIVVKDFRAGNIVAFKVSDLTHRHEEALATVHRRHEELVAEIERKHEKQLADLRVLLDESKEREDAYRVWIGTRR